MKRMLTVVLLGMIAVSLSACASLAPRGEVKFPAQGYEFESPMGG